MRKAHMYFQTLFSNHAKLKQKFRLLSLAIPMMLSSCLHTFSDTNLSQIDTLNETELANVSVTLSQQVDSKSSLSNIRIQSLQDSAMTMGAQAGLAWAAERINAKLEIDSKYLQNIYNFGGLMLNHGVMPPVLTMGDNNLSLDDPTTIRVADRTYKIVKQAQFATTPPHWREYLWLNFNKPALPDRTLLPKNAEEKSIWRKGIVDGWQKGIEQAYNIFQQNLARIKRDYNGMLLYRKLLEQKIISEPFVSRTELGITGDGNDMRVNDQVLRIVELPQLQKEGNKWQAVVVKKHD